MHFAPEDLPPTLDWVERDFPFPLALTYARLRTAFDRHPLEAVWAVRDAWEVAIKFCACVSVADFLHADPDKPTAERVAVGLLSDRGVAIGKWVEVLVATIEDTSSPARKLPRLRTVFREGDGSDTTPQFDAVLRFAGWRNDVFGHGVFTHDLPWYAKEAVQWMQQLLALYAALRPVFDGWALVGRTADGQAVDWSGCDFQPKRDRHQHDPVGSALPLFLTRDGVELSFGPLLSVQRCKECDHPAAFFFDRQRTADDTVLLEYVAGVKGKKKQWDEVAKLSAWLPTDFKWERRLYDTGELLDGIPIVFRDFDREYVRPAYLLDAIRQRQKSAKRGYILLDGPEGTGKSYLARGLAEKEAGGLKVLAYYVRPGDLSHFASFLIELNRQVHDKLLPANKRTFEPQAKGAKTPAELQAEFVDYFTTVLAGRAGAVLVIDALDELPDSDPSTPLITDLLPDPAKLPPNLHIVLTARAGELKPRAAARWQALAAGSLRLTLDPTSEANRGLVGEYLAREQVAAADDILARSGGVFLYAWHFVAALRQGVFTGTADLPPAEQFYPAFLERIRRRVGDTLFDTVYRRLLLLLCAARVPVTREQIERWGIPADRLTTALGELRDFVRQIRHRDWHEGMGDDTEPRYKIAHEAFVRYAEAHEVERLKAAHRTIATAALRHTETKWEGLDPADDADLYNVRFVQWHCEAGGLTADAEGLRGDELLALAASRVAARLAEVARYLLALELDSQCEQIYKILIGMGRDGLKNDLASTLMNKGATLGQLGWYADAVACLDETIPIFRLLVVGGQGELASHLAGALVNRGNVLLGLRRLGEAVMSFDEAIGVYSRMITSGFEVWASESATVLMNKGVVLRQLGRLPAAVECYDEAIAIRRRLVRDGEGEWVDDLAAVLVNKGYALQELGRLGEAMVCFDEAIGEYQRLVTSGRFWLASDLATALVGKGDAFQRLGRLGDAVEYFDQAIVYRRQLVESGREELVGDLAAAIGSKGVALRGMGRLLEALGCHDEVIAVYRGLIKSGRTEQSNHLATALVNKGVVFQVLNRLGEAVVCYDEAILIRRRLVETGRDELANDLAAALLNKGAALRNLGRTGEAVECLDEAILIRRRLVEAGRDELASNLAKAIMNKGNALTQLGWLTEAVGCYDEAIDLFRRLIGGGQSKYVNDLARSLMNRATALTQLDSLDEAALCLNEAVELFFRLFHSGQPQFLPDLLQVLRIRFSLAVTQNDWPTAAGVLAIGWQTFVIKERGGANTQSDQDQLGHLLRSVVVLSNNQKRQLLSAAPPGLAEYLRSQGFSDDQAR